MGTLAAPITSVFLPESWSRVRPKWKWHPGIKRQSTSYGTNLTPPRTFAYAFLSTFSPQPRFFLWLIASPRSGICSVDLLRETADERVPKLPKSHQMYAYFPHAPPVASPIKSCVETFDQPTVVVYVKLQNSTNHGNKSKIGGLFHKNMLIF